MRTIGVRLYGSCDIRLEGFELPEITADEVLMRVVCDSVCASTYKAVIQGKNHKRVPDTVDRQPVIIGHEFCGEILKVGKNLKNEWKPGMKAVIQPALKLESGYDPGYSYPYIGGNTMYAVIPEIVIKRGCLLHYAGNSYFEGALAECLGCDLRGIKGLYHTDYTNYVRSDGPKARGRVAILGGAGPMGIGLAELLCGVSDVSQIVVIDIDGERLSDAKQKMGSSGEKETAVRFENITGIENVEEHLKNISNGGFDDVFVMAPSNHLFATAEKICREDGCINFFAGPPQHVFPGTLNLYRVHYDGIHVVGTAGSIPADMKEILGLIEEKKIRPAVLVTHILGLNALKETVFAMKTPNGGKKVCYNGIELPLTAIRDLPELGKTSKLYRELGTIVSKNGGLWCEEAERYLLKHAPKADEGEFI